MSSHARAHLRQIGIPDSEIKSGPIEYLYQMMEEEDLKPISAEQEEDLTSNSSPRSSNKRPSDLSSPPASPLSKRPKTSADCTCVLCGEVFENRKGLASHARSHLRHIGVSDLVGKSSAIDAVQELVSSGVLETTPPQKTNSASTSSAAPSQTPTSPSVPAPSPAPSHSRASFSPTCLTPSSAKSSHSSQPPLNRAPKAKKGFRLAVDPLHRKPKPEPVETEVSVQLKTSSSNSPLQKSPSASVSTKPVDSGKKLLISVCFTILLVTYYSIKISINLYVDVHQILDV